MRVLRVKVLDRGSHIGSDRSYEKKPEIRINFLGIANEYRSVIQESYSLLQVNEVQMSRDVESTINLSLT
jgi:hypothetical protein